MNLHSAAKVSFRSLRSNKMRSALTMLGMIIGVAAVIVMVAIGEGITLVSEGWTSMAHADLAMRPLTAAEDIVPFSAVWSPSSDNPALRRFLSFARDLAARQRVRRHQ